MLKNLLDAHLDGLVKTKEDEIAYLRQHFGDRTATAAAVTARTIV
jgi:hypothetical protein